MKRWKQYAAAALAVLTFAASLPAEAHFLFSRQEKEIGNQAVKDFMDEIRCERNWILDHIQKRLLQYNPGKLWMYGTFGKKRGLEPVLLAKSDYANAVSYGGGQIFINEGYFVQLANKRAENFFIDKSEQNPWKKSNIYQMSAMAAVMGHEMGHWANEDMLDEFDRDIIFRGLAAVFSYVNPWAAFGVPIGTNLINRFCTRQMSFDAEKHADEKAMEYAMYVPEYSVGGEAIVEYCAYQYKTAKGIEDRVTNWLHPHSTTAKRLERALRYQEELSKGFIKWDGFAPEFGGFQCGQYLFYSKEKENFDATERSLYVVGQIATAIHFDFCKERCLRVERENDVFSDGSPNNVVLILEGRGNDYMDHFKIIDTYYGIPWKDAKFLAEGEWEQVAPRIDQLLNTGTEISNLAYTRFIIHHYQKNRASYVHRPIE